jgi:hypothetical protein
MDDRSHHRTRPRCEHHPYWVRSYWVRSPRSDRVIPHQPIRRRLVRPEPTQHGGGPPYVVIRSGRGCRRRWRGPQSPPRTRTGRWIHRAKRTAWPVSSTPRGTRSRRVGTSVGSTPPRPRLAGAGPAGAAELARLQRASKARPSPPTRAVPLSAAPDQQPPSPAVPSRLAYGVLSHLRRALATVFSRSPGRSAAATSSRRCRSAAGR